MVLVWTLIVSDPQTPEGSLSEESTHMDRNLLKIDTLESVEQLIYK